MPITPNDPEYKEIMQRHRAEVAKYRKKEKKREKRIRSTKEFFNLD